MPGFIASSVPLSPPHPCPGTLPLSRPFPLSLLPPHACSQDYPDHAVLTAAFSPCGHRLFIGSQDCTASCWSQAPHVEAGEPETCEALPPSFHPSDTVEVQRGAVHLIAFSHRGDRIAIGTKAGHVEVRGPGELGGAAQAWCPACFQRAPQVRAVQPLLRPPEAAPCPQPCKGVACQ